MCKTADFQQRKTSDVAQAGGLALLRCHIELRVLPICGKLAGPLAVTKRSVLEQLTRPELQAIADGAQLEVADRRVRDQLVEAAASSRRDGDDCDPDQTRVADCSPANGFACTKFVGNNKPQTVDKCR